MTRRLISSGSTFEKEIGYSRAVADLVEQTEQCLKNIESALKQAGASLADVVRVTYVLPNGGDFPKCWPVLKKYFGEVRPAAMMISAGLADPRMQIEIEVTALKRQPG